jgi:hypothetical protein
MKINESQLRKIIQENVKKVLMEIKDASYSFKPEDVAYSWKPSAKDEMYDKIIEILYKYRPKDKLDIEHNVIHRNEFYGAALHNMFYGARNPEDYKKVIEICEFLLKNKGLTISDENSALFYVKNSFKQTKKWLELRINMAKDRLQKISNQSQPT